ncbi:protein-S-isoprenylcysteine O-methyltransferase [Methylobacillus flagellatus]|uniref:protein-S-isoprenylcysteine O-methyltransferase n=1 Tax=Methylobacillus flagellatus TaxID=405 RepID=UPI0028688C0A|nr:protein-S-isoprenylcysteine O-methyltransferase [Methylobacillus flagellatus]
MYHHGPYARAWHPPGRYPAQQPDSYPVCLAQAAHQNQQRDKDLQERILLGLAGVGMMLLPLAYAATSWLDFADYGFQSWAGGAGSFIMLVAMWLFWRSHHDLGDNWSVTLEIRDQQSLVTHGVYRSMRHPMYASIWLWCIAQALLVANWLVGPAGLLAFGLMYWLREFGNKYTQYMQRSGRILPFGQHPPAH